VVFDPLGSPFNGLAPPIGVRVENAEVDVLQSEFLIEITTIVAVVEAVVGLDVETSLTAPGNHVVRVNGLDESAHLIDPFGDGVGCAGSATGKVANTVSAAAWLVSKLPSENAGGVGVALDDLTNVVLVGFLDLWLAVELSLVSMRSP
jgi:hypothetical protein